MSGTNTVVKEYASTSLAGENNIMPFWRRIPKFFLFPFHFKVLWVLIALAMASLLAPFIPVISPIDFILVEALIWLAAMRHAFGIMEKTTSGLLSPDQYPPISESNSERVNLPWKLVAIFIVWSFVIILVAYINNTLAKSSVILFNFIVPATIMTLSVTNSMIAALNPANMFALISDVGKPYIALVIFLFLLSGGGELALPILLPIIPEAMLLPVFNFVFLYFNMVMFNMMGYALYQYHENLGITVKVSANQQQASGKTKDLNVNQENIANMIAEGNLKEALDLAYEDQRKRPNDIAAHDRYNKLLIMNGKQEKALQHGQLYMSVLSRMGRFDLALEILKRLRELDDKLQPEQTAMTLPLAKAALDGNDPAMALSLLLGFDKRHPGDKEIPVVYLLTAKILSENFRKDTLSCILLEEMLNKYPEHPQAAEARSLLTTLQQFTANTPGQN